MGETIVFTNGCFDILHAGHIDYLYKASLLGTRLILGLNSDASVSALKGPSRPVNAEADRALILASLSFIDGVTIFAEDTPAELIAALQPDFLVKGADYRPQGLPGAATVWSRGGSVVLLPILSGRSTSGTILKLRLR